MSIHDQPTEITNVSKAVAVGAQQDCLVIIHHKRKDQQGKRRELGGSSIRIGRESDNELVLLDEGISRRHARVERRGTGWVVMDTSSRNGTLINGKLLSGVRRLQNGDLLKIGSVILKYLSGSDVEAALYDEVFQLTITDNLTQLANRRKFDEELSVELGRVRRHARPLSLLLLDIDFFKRVNDTHGHQAGDAVLAELGRLLRARVRGHDTAARLGGEEFAVLLPETDLAGARALAEELRAAVEQQPVEYLGAVIQTTVSIGCVQFEPADVDPAALVRRCDEKLYAAKAAGRNRCVG